MRKILVLLVLLLTIPNLVKAQDYLTFTSNQDDSEIGFEKIASGVKIQYNDGAGWKDADVNTSITLASGESVKFKGDYSGFEPYFAEKYTNFKITGNVSLSGDINTLFDGVGGDITLKNFNYAKLFQNCIGLTDVTGLKLPSLTVSEGCYHRIFEGCTGLTDVSELKLPATTLAKDCYSYMFKGCTGLTKAPVLPATSLANSCYWSMFEGCTSLTTAPELPATKLAEYCYFTMFYDCYNLTSVPNLPATILPGNCYCQMFTNCRKLNIIKVDFIEWNPSNNATQEWVKNVASTGTFICPEGLDEQTRDISNIPQDWTVKHPEYLTFTSNQDGSTIGFVKIADGAKIEYKEGDGWKDASELKTTPLTLNSGQSVKFKGDYSNATINTTSSTWFDISGNVSVSGDINTLIDGVGGDIELKDNIYYHLFNGCKGLTDASNLKFPSKNLKPNSYASMFQGCTGLTSAPKELPATNLAESCYAYMFNGCKSLTIAPELPAKSLAEGCYQGMFIDCTSLNKISVKFIDWNTSNSSTTNWVDGVAASGTFICPDELDVTQFNSSFVPKDASNKWTIAKPNYLTMTATKSTTIGLKYVGDFTIANVEYSLDNGNTWNELNASSSFTLDANKTALFRGDNPSGFSKQLKGYGAYGSYSNCTNTDYTYFTISGDVKLSGSIMSLIDKIGIETTIPNRFCFLHLFGECNISEISEDLLTATDVKECCYWDLFKNCSLLKSVPEKLFSKIKELKPAIFRGTFFACTSITELPENLLPFETLSKECYMDMFNSCSNITTAPKLPATTLVDMCYQGLFQHCTKLNKIEVNFTDWNSSQSSTTNWVYNVASTGAFICPSELEDVRGTSNIPTDWKRPEYLTFTSNQDGSTIGFVKIADGAKIEYKEGDGWKDASELKTTPLTLNSGQSVKFRGDYSNVTTSKTVYTQFDITGNVSASGDVNTLIDCVGGDIELSSYNYSRMFMECAGLTDASGLKLPSTTMSESCCYQMFSACSALTKAPDLKATQMATRCYQEMFNLCTSLTEAPKLKATNLAEYCYADMFHSCRKLLQGPTLLATDLYEGCYSYMFVDCKSLIVAPSLRATTLAKNCYKSMFKDCSSLFYVSISKCLSAFDNNYTSEWLSGVASVGVFICGDITQVSDIKRGANYIPEGWYVGGYYVALSEDNINEGLSLSKSKYYNKDLEGMLAKMPTYQQMPDNYIDNTYSMDDTIKVNPENYEIYDMFYQSSPTADPIPIEYDKTNNTFAVSSLQNGQFVITISGSKLYQVKYYSNDMELGAEIDQNDKTPIVFRKGAKKSDLQSFSIDGCFPEIYTDAECTKPLGEDELLVSYCDNGLVKLYKKPIEYTITFDTKGNNTINPITYTVESETIDLSSYKGEKEGYHFVKWVDDKDAEVTQIVKGSFGNVELTALFEAHSFTKYTYNNDATTETDGTETAVCDHEGCNAIDVRIAKGTKLTSIANEIVNSLVIYAHHNTIVVENAVEDIFIYDIDGRCVANRDAASHVSITMQREGIYIVKCGNTVKRVLVM